MNATKTCDNCSHRTSIPMGSNGFEYPKPICDKNCHEFCWGEGKPGTCGFWKAKDIPFYLQRPNENK